MKTKAFFEGWESQAYKLLGSHKTRNGIRFSVWAPNAQAVSVVGSFNDWSTESDPMVVEDGLWTIMCPNAKLGDTYKFAILPAHSREWLWKTDPFARQIESPPETASIIHKFTYKWKDHSFRKDLLRNKGAMSIYELHLGSWKRHNGEFPSYRSIANELIAYLKKLNVTHVEFMPLTHHPFYGSWGYQCLGYFAPIRTFGEPEDLKYLIDRLHRNGIGCILDWVPAHFPMDSWGLYQFDGEAVFEHPDPRRGYHPDWKTAIFDYGRPEVLSFLLSSARFWLEEFHFDALRVDAVSSMLYLNYSREEGEWLPNSNGGHENYEAINFFRMLEEMVANLNQGHIIIAEESTNWHKVSHPVSDGGVGFHLKWDMGWMHDTLQYMSREPIHRSYHHNEITFRGVYAFHENFVLALSHDEVVHGKGSIINKMPGDHWQKIANCKLLFAMMMAQPGKKMIFMGMEIGQYSEWNHDTELDWHLLDNPEHKQLQQCYADLNALYRSQTALHDDQHTGTHYSLMDDNGNSVMAFVRRNNGKVFLAAFNCTPQPIYDYTVGVPMPGKWVEIFNTDELKYGGSGVVAQQPVLTTNTHNHGFDQSMSIGMPPLGACFWVLEEA